MNTTPSFIFPGAFVETRDKRKALIYVTDADKTRPIHGTRFCEDRLYVTSWLRSGSFSRLTDENAWDIIGPWIDKPDRSKLWPIFPPWIKWLVQNADGRWFGSSCKPINDEIRDWWYFSQHDTHYSMDIHPDYYPTFIGNWRESLVERPK